MNKIKILLSLKIRNFYGTILLGLEKAEETEIKLLTSTGP